MKKQSTLNQDEHMKIKYRLVEFNGQVYEKVCLDKLSI